MKFLQENLKEFALYIDGVRIHLPYFSKIITVWMQFIMEINKITMAKKSGRATSKEKENNIVTEDLNWIWIWF